MTSLSLRDLRRPVGPAAKMDDHPRPVGPAGSPACDPDAAGGSGDYSTLILAGGPTASTLILAGGPTAPPEGWVGTKARLIFASPGYNLQGQRTAQGPGSSVQLFSECSQLFRPSYN